MRGADLRHANLVGADLRFARTQGPRLQGAVRE
ncbi:pentapeptide repeat-containing protein [Synechococcus sp. W65.1]